MKGGRYAFSFRGALFPTIKNGSYWKYYKVSEFLEHLEDPEAKDGQVTL